MNARRRRAHRAAVVRLAVAAAAAGGMSLGAVAMQLPLAPISETGQSVTAAYEGWFKNPDGTFSLLIGYFNRNTKQTLDIPVGPNNRVEPGGPDRGQPTRFLPRRNWGVFTVIVPADFGDQKVTWTIVANGKTTSVPMGLNPVYEVEPYKEQAQGNTPPMLRFEPSGVVFQGPPKGIAASYTASVGTPLELTVWTSDEQLKEPARTEPGPFARGPRISLTWILHRGPADVTFSNPKPEIDIKGDGKATTSATFATPGEYVLRAQLNDASGDGGGGFQCCWTNVHVVVKALRR